MIITSVHNPRIKSARLLRDRRGRQRQALILIDGAREIDRALAGGVALQQVFVCPELVNPTLLEEYSKRWSEAGAEICAVTNAVWQRLAYGDRNDGVLAVARPLERALSTIAIHGPALVVVLERLEKPGNLGAVLRSADAVGAAAVIVADPATDLFNPNVIRASLGTVFTVPCCAADASETLAWLQGAGFAIFAARVDGRTAYTQANFAGRTALVLGSEADGLTSVWHSQGVTPIHLPMRGVADSLNVSATAAVLLYEALRQRLPK